MKPSTYYGGSDLLDLSGGGAVVLADPANFDFLRLGANVGYVVNQTGENLEIRKSTGDVVKTIATNKVAKLSILGIENGGTWSAAVFDLLVA